MYLYNWWVQCAIIIKCPATKLLVRRRVNNNWCHGIPSRPLRAEFLWIQRSGYIQQIYMESTCEAHDNNKNVWEAKREVSVIFHGALRAQGSVSTLSSLEPAAKLGWRQVCSACRVFKGIYNHWLRCENWETSLRNPRKEWGSWLNFNFLIYEMRGGNWPHLRL